MTGGVGEGWTLKVAKKKLIRSREPSCKTTKKRKFSFWWKRRRPTPDYKRMDEVRTPMSTELMAQRQELFATSAERRAMAAAAAAAAEATSVDTTLASPPPSYEHVLAETRLAAAQAESAQALDAGGGEKGQMQQPPAVRRPVEIIHKSSKELYRAVAAQWGITCKMSDHCRCLDCQSNYFDCEYDQNEHEKTDGGLGAGTPMFISEVMHGTACAIL
uniref:DUF4802 domain-containing protein n=2 Tax=Timema TaxID=61471 RepID=A0A7R9EE01_9NEOP|nr:unnamed protein product [Timema monikensis]